MSAKFNSVGRNCLVFSKEKKNGKHTINFEGASVGHLLDHIGIEESQSSESTEVSIEWFPKKMDPLQTNKIFQYRFKK